VDQNEDGLTLVEMMVALMVLGVVLTAMASVLMTSMVSMQRSERVVHSTQLGNEILEGYLALPYDVLGHYTTEATDHFGGSTFEGESLVLFPDADTPDERVPSPTQPPITRSGISYEVETAVTWVNDPDTAVDQDYKRITVMLTWEHRGDVRTSRTETTRAPAPDDQPLTASIEPDVIKIDENGTIAGSEYRFDIVVTAKEPQSAVRVRWTRRNGEKSDWRLLESDHPHRLVWEDTIRESSVQARFANGGTLFEVEGTSAANEKITTTIGRGVFLHDLEMPADRLTVEPSTIWVHPDDGACEPLDITAEVVGAVVSDPLSLIFEGDDDADAWPFSALTKLTDGSRYHLEVPTEHLPVSYGNDEDATLRYDLQLLRAVDPDSPDGAELTKTVEMSVRDVVADDEGVIACP
jgi:prepilin-type N-terminal cleavage/methylation domain-containing protein